MKARLIMSDQDILVLRSVTTTASQSCKTNIISVLGREEGYTVKYTHLPEGVPEGKAIKISKEIESLKGEVNKVKQENTEKINMLAKVH